MAGAQYDPKAIIATIVSPLPGIGSHTITGYQDGTMLVAERNSDLNELTPGAQGDFAFTLKRDRSGTITLSLLQTSPSNAVLSQIALADQISGQGVFSIQIKDNESGSVGGATVAKIQKHSNMEFSNEITVREWIITCGELNLLEDAYSAL